MKLLPRLLQDTDLVDLAPFAVRINTVPGVADDIKIGKVQNTVTGWMNEAFPPLLESAGFTVEENYAPFATVALVGGAQNASESLNDVFAATFTGGAAFLLVNETMPVPEDEVLKIQEAILRDEQDALLAELQSSSGSGLGSNVLSVDAALLDGMSTPIPAPAPTVESSDPPTVSPTASPTVFTGQEVELTFDDVLLEFGNVGNLTESDIEAFQNVTEQWYEEFYETRSFNISDFETEITVKGQNVTNGTSTNNTLTYDQIITFAQRGDIMVEYEDYLTTPFLVDSSNEEYSTLLSTTIEAFADVQTPISVPQITNVTEKVIDIGPTTSPSDDTLSTSQIVGIALGAGSVFLVCVLFCCQAGGKWRSDRAAE